MSEGLILAPDGAKAVTAKDVITEAQPQKMEAVELYLIVNAAGTFKEVIPVRPEIGEKCELKVSPLDGSILGLVFSFKTGDDKNEQKGKRYVALNNLLYFDVAYTQQPVYAPGESPAEIELKRRNDARAKSIQERAAKLAEGLDEQDLD